MLLLIAGLALFFIAHLVPTATNVRDELIARAGPSGYKGLFSIASAIGLALIVIGYGQVRFDGNVNPAIWTPPAWTRHVAFTLMLPAMILLVAAFVPSRIRTAVKHPMLAAIKIWALAHLIANGDLASMLLFGGFLAYGIWDRISVKKRAAAGPLGQRTGPAINDAIVVAAGLALYVVTLLWGHYWLIGVPLVSR